MCSRELRRAADQFREPFKKVTHQVNQGLIFFHSFFQVYDSEIIPPTLVFHRDGSVVLENYDPILNETAACLRVLQGAVESPSLTGKIQRLMIKRNSRKTLNRAYRRYEKKETV